MALTPYQRVVCRILADLRLAAGESYVAGGLALNEILATSRVSRDIDLFHDSVAALEASWAEDRAALEERGHHVEVVRERTGFVEARVGKDGKDVLVQWVNDSAYRFFPLVEHPVLGLTLHPFDLATNKVLALIGRSEPRDLVDTLACHDRLQPFGYLAFAACGKDPGFGPDAIVELAARSSRYARAELAGLDFDGPSPDAADLSRRWHSAVLQARSLVRGLPGEEAGRAVLTRDLELFRGGPEELASALARRDLRFHEGSIRGVFPQIRG